MAGPIKTEMKQFRKTKTRWGQIMLCVVVCALLVTCFSLPAPADAADEPASYRVVFVADDDTLNVRSAPGASNPAVGSLAPGTQGVRITGGKKLVGNSAWYPISSSGLTGWVNGLFLTREVAPKEFCEYELGDFLSTLTSAIHEKNGEMLASIVDEERGLRLYLDPWSKGVRLSAKQLRTIFSDPTKSTWGLDPDGVPVETGTFSENVLPLLERDMLSSTTMTCNAMKHPEASGPHKLPQGCDGINYYSYYRSPGPGEAVQDWGEWVVGVETWKNRPVLGYLAHYQWTP